MTASCSAARPIASSRHGQLVGRISQDGRSFEGLRKLFRQLWPSKTPIELADRIESSVRHAERILSGERGISGETIHALLHTDDGWPVLEELMRGCTAPWWRDLQRTHRIADLLRRQDENQRVLTELLKPAD